MIIWLGAAAATLAIQKSWFRKDAFGSGAFLSRASLADAHSARFGACLRTSDNGPRPRRRARNQALTDAGECLWMIIRASHPAARFPGCGENRWAWLMYVLNFYLFFLLFKFCFAELEAIYERHVECIDAPCCVRTENTPPIYWSFAPAKVTWNTHYFIRFTYYMRDLRHIGRRQAALGGTTQQFPK